MGFGMFALTHPGNQKLEISRGHHLKSCEHSPGGSAASQGLALYPVHSDSALGLFCRMS